MLNPPGIREPGRSNRAKVTKWVSVEPGPRLKCACLQSLFAEPVYCPALTVPPIAAVPGTTSVPGLWKGGLDLLACVKGFSLCACGWDRKTGRARWQGPVGSWDWMLRCHG